MPLRTYLCTHCHFCWYTPGACVSSRHGRARLAHGEGVQVLTASASPRPHASPPNYSTETVYGAARSLKEAGCWDERAGGRASPHGGTSSGDLLRDCCQGTFLASSHAKTPRTTWLPCASSHLFNYRQLLSRGPPSRSTGSPGDAPEGLLSSPGVQLSHQFQFK